MTNSTLQSCRNFPFVFEGSLWGYFWVTVTLAIIINCSILAIVGNTFVCYLICTTRQLWTKQYILVVNLIFIDLLTAIIGIPSYSVFLLFFILGRPACTARAVHLITSAISLSMTVINLSLLSYERFFAVFFPYRYQTFLTAQRLMVLAGVSWLYGLLLIVPAFMKMATQWNGWQALWLASSTVFFAHILSSLICYGKIHLVARQHQQSTSRCSVRVRLLSRSSKTFLYVIGAFLLCSLPSCITAFVQDPPVEVLNFACGSLLTSSGINWLIYTLRNEDIQLAIQRNLKRRVDTIVYRS